MFTSSPSSSSSSSWSSSCSHHHHHNHVHIITITIVTIIIIIIIMFTSSSSSSSCSHHHLYHHHHHNHHNNHHHHHRINATNLTIAITMVLISRLMPYHALYLLHSAVWKKRFNSYSIRNGIRRNTYKYFPSLFREHYIDYCFVII